MEARPRVSRTVRAKPLILPDGAIVSGTSTESYQSWAIWIERSTDAGKTWVKIGPILPPVDLETKGEGDLKYPNGMIQPSVVSLGGTHLPPYARSTAKFARVCVADSYNNGVTWTRARLLDVPNPNSGIDALALRDGRIVLIYNNAISGRTPLNLDHSSLERRPGNDLYLGP